MTSRLGTGKSTFFYSVQYSKICRDLPEGQPGLWSQLLIRFSHLDLRSATTRRNNRLFWAKARRKTVPFWAEVNRQTVLFGDRVDRKTVLVQGKGNLNSFPFLSPVPVHVRFLAFRKSGLVRAFFYRKICNF